MRLPSSSSLVLASLVVSSSSSSSPSALAAPVGDGPEDSSSYAPAAVLLAQHAPNPPTLQINCKILWTKLLDIPLELRKAGILNVILYPLVGKYAPKVKNLVPTVKKTMGGGGR
ncbi:hypothetical protein F5888DRAFT_1802619 [Russula emetica]|nr:hypothetical protein F5888DRAFT_1802619 [Russula emetica]